MHKIVAANGLRARIGQQWKTVTFLLREIARDLWWIHADCDRTNPGFIELVQIALDAPQLGVT